MGRFVLGIYSTEIADSGATVFQSVAVQHLAPIAAFWNAYAIALTRARSFAHVHGVFFRRIDQ